MKQRQRWVIDFGDHRHAGYQMARWFSTLCGRFPTFHQIDGAYRAEWFGVTCEACTDDPGYQQWREAEKAEREKRNSQQPHMVAHSRTGKKAHARYSNEDRTLCGVVRTSRWSGGWATVTCQACQRSSAYRVWRQEQGIT